MGTMGQSKRHASTRHSRHHAIAVLLAVSCAVLPTVAVADDALEREQLSALARQLDLIKRLAEHAATTASPQSNQRYHFDYERLRADLQRVHAGVQSYMVPERAQPRDPEPLVGGYIRHDELQEPSP